MTVITISNQKGGVGKTTTTLNLGAALRELGKRVLLLDFDPQGNLSVAAGIEDASDLKQTIGDLMVTSIRSRSTVPSILDLVIPSPAGLDLVPANAALSAAELALVSAMNRESTLAALLRPAAESYDYVLIDCLPSVGLLAINALRAADGVIIPVQADYLAMQGLAQLFETVAAVRENLHPTLEIYGVLLTMVDQRTAHAREVVRTVRETLVDQVRVFDAEIRLHVALKDSTRMGRSILETEPDSPGALSHRLLAREVLTALGDAPVEPAEPIQPEATAAIESNLAEPPASVDVSESAPRAEVLDFTAFVKVHPRWLGDGAAAERESSVVNP